MVQRHNWTIFFENEQGKAVTVNGDRYRVMLNEFLFTKIKEEDIGRITLDVLRPVFEDRRRADVVWPSLSYDLIPFDYYLLGGVEDK